MTPPRVLAAAGVSAGGNPGKDVGASLRRASGTPPPTGCREWAAAGGRPSSGPAGPPSPKGEGKGCCWRRRESPRGVGDAAPYGLPGNGRQREAAPHPALRGRLPPRGKARVVVGGSASLRGASGTPPPTGCPGMNGGWSLPLIRPCGATFPQGGRQGLLLAAAGACPLPRQLVLGAELEGQAVVPTV